ncbi:sphingomyelin phosphodiesterase, putative [Entamoeba invadens IP1]|uniref:Sphingomyelin phosphodiesterase, putative n=1 Tax=Entamoeba invadens IP1 TaxID=370355 RepID=L7FMU7_ENTIV|nr:sphingomyelin phosphodiesterase, putative [Entamoeba invadens IP1]ELP89736.1 sphingomyelin phosphodiesterase, putative [Entamoeba invadens IP1]|eukprot:XP_004256507.1 sphingomyelin phosphodiesterase, putative [Entamoeba invadens IP1]
MLNIMGDLFSPWLSERSLELFRKGGYYSELLEPNIRLVSMNFAYMDMYGVHCGDYATTDPAGMVQWFNQTLQLAQKANEKIVILSHECIGLKSTGIVDLAPKFNTDFDELMRSYSDVIITHLCGHLHYDSLMIYPTYDTAYYHCIVNPAMTTKATLDPRFRLLELNENSVVGWKQYFLDIEKCNLEGKFEWKLEYETLKEYGIDKWDTTHIKTFLTNLERNETLFNVWKMHFGEHGGHTFNGNTKKDFLCASMSLTEQTFIECINNYPIK